MKYPKKYYLRPQVEIVCLKDPLMQIPDLSDGETSNPLGKENYFEWDDEGSHDLWGDDSDEEGL